MIYISIIICIIVAEERDIIVQEVERKDNEDDDEKMYNIELFFRCSAPREQVGSCTMERSAGICRVHLFHSLDYFYGEPVARIGWCKSPPRPGF